MRTYVRWVIQHAKAVLVAVAVITVFLITRLNHLHVEAVLDDNLPPDHPYIQTFNQIDKYFGQRDIVFAAFQVKEGTAVDARILKMISAITSDMQALPGVNAQNVLSLTARKAKDIKGTAEGLTADPLVKDLGEIAELPEKIRRNPVYQQSIISKDLKTTAIVVDFKYDKTHDSIKEENAVRGVIEKHLIPGVTYGLSGSPILLASVERYTEKLKIYFAIAILVIGLVHFEAFRSLQGFILPLLTALLSVIWATGFLCATGFSRLDPTTATTPILILAVAAGHAVQILKRYYEEFERLGDNSAAIEEALVKVGPVMLLAGAAAAASFLSLLAFDVPMIRTFGRYSAAGILAALVIEMTFTPALRSLLPPPKAKLHSGAFLESALEFVLPRIVVPARYKYVLIAAGIVAVACGFFMTQVKVDNAAKRHFPAWHPLVVDDTWINNALGGTETISFLIEGAADDLKRPDVLRAMDKLQTALEGDARVGKTIGLPYFVKTMNQAMHDGKPEFYSVPDSKELVAQYLLLYGMSGDPTDFDTYVTNDYDKAQIIALLRTSSTADFAQINAKITKIARQELPAGVRVHVGGSLANLSALNEVLVRGKIFNIIQILLVILTIGSLAFRSFIGGILTVVPIFMTVLFNFGVMGLLGIRLDLPTSVLSALAVGLGADYAIYFMSRFKEEIAKSCGDWDSAMRATMITTGKGIFFVCSAVGSGYLTLCLSSFAFHYLVGSLVALSMAVAGIVSLTLLPVLMNVIRPAFFTKTMVKREAPEPVAGVSPRAA